MREKYVEERFPRFMVFGESSDGTTVDVADINRDVVTSVERAEADYLIARYDALVDFIHAMACSYEQADDAAFKKFWYEED